ncbi:protein N-terminal asparagine amidohydrolase-like [Gigantopelta aegis]|uniref:protein N-terminal asparagine amidohydrolase-like n=1 Tax=Gigantopelta aegis TaxID=1735272 RepID=UPI001B88AFD5|nr:protein N-terminal asparagine amidohydrolase-like [Gigantopelta aegis]XP_041363948.1 protein N-terminal asparagine amidohydrolase-like [Gigantopelta aegis]
MPLIVEGRLVEVPASVAEFFKTYPNFKLSSERLCSQQSQEVGPKGLLYVGQREIGGTTPDDDDVHVLGSDDATTCHVVVLLHTGSGAVCIGHFDGCETKKGLESMVELVLELSKDETSGRLEIHLVGGFTDEAGHSEKLSLEILKVLTGHPSEISLVTACITDQNTVYKEGVPFPVIYGLAVDVKTRNLYKATFSDKGPDLPLRGARHFTGGKEMINIYDSHRRWLKIGPFTYKPMHYLEMWCEAPDYIIRQNLSTSPAQEPEHFEASVRASLHQMLDHPEPMKTVFSDGKPRTYTKQPDGEWKRVEQTS